MDGNTKTHYWERSTSTTLVLYPSFSKQTSGKEPWRLTPETPRESFVNHLCTTVFPSVTAPAFYGRRFSHRRSRLVLELAARRDYREA